MRKILLVDDESYIRSGLRALIERSESNFKEIYECEDGKSALEMIKSGKFDLVVTDIRMPFLDGIAFIKEAQEIENKPKFIILSGYDDFKYAKQSMKYGVKDYLLKPVDRFELIETLDKIEKQLDEEEDNSKKMELSEEIIKQISSDELNYILLNKNIDIKDIRKILDAVHLDIFDRKFSIAVAYMDLNECKSDNDSYNIFKAHLNAFFIKVNITAISFIDTNGNFVVAFNDEISSSDLYDFLLEKKVREFFVGISSLGNGVTDIHIKYFQAYEALKYRLIKDSQYILKFSDITNLKMDNINFEDKVYKISEMIGVNKSDEINKALSGIFDTQLIGDWNLVYVENTSKSIGKHIVDKFIKLIPKDADFNYSELELLKSIFNFKNIDSYLTELNRFINQISDYILELKKEYKEQSSIDMALNWINENYHKNDLTMTLVANQVSLNYSYFSLAFKEHTGMSFVNYVKKIRIAKAKEILKTTELKIYEVAQKVGFQSPRLFAKSFKEEVGISPFDYSKKII